MIKLILGIILLGAAGTGIYFWQQKQSAEAAKPVETPATKIARGNIKLSVATTGRIVANLDVDIKCKASGQVIKLPFDVSDSVKKGDLILELDPIDELRQVNLAEVELSSSTAKLISAKQNLVIAEQKLITDRLRAEASEKSAQARYDRSRIKADRLKTALASNAASREEYDTAETETVQSNAELTITKAQIEELKQHESALEVRRQDVKLAEAQVRSDQIALANTQQRMADTKVVAPIDAVIASRPVQIGQIISSGISNVGGGTTVLTLSDLSHLYTLASVDESDIGKVQLGQEVAITADAFPGRRFKGLRGGRRGVTGGARC